MGEKLGGRWLPPTKVHECRLPYLWFAKSGQRWECLGKLGDGQTVCHRTWRVEDGMDGKLWVEEEHVEPDGTFEVFRRVDDNELEYWVGEELGGSLAFAPGDNPDPKTVLDAVRKHFEIGRKQ